MLCATIQVNISGATTNNAINLACLVIKNNILTTELSCHPVWLLHIIYYIMTDVKNDLQTLLCINLNKGRNLFYW